LDAFWTLAGVIGIYTIVVLSLILSVLAVFYAYRLSRITGLFSAWTLLIAGLILTSFEDFAYFGTVIFVSYSKVESQAEAFTPGSFSFLTLILICIPALFFGAMFQLYAMFKSQQEKVKLSSREENPALVQ
jgi:hypothetical protein